MGEKPEKAGRLSRGVAHVSKEQDSREEQDGSKVSFSRVEPVTHNLLVPRMDNAGCRRRAYLFLIKTGFDWALPPPVTMMMKDIPAFASGTVASIIESPMNLKTTGVFEAELKVTV